MEGALPESLHELTVADVMLGNPKTIPSGTTVGEAREALSDHHVQMLLLVDGTAFQGAVTSIPDDADPGSLVSEYVDPTTETLAPTESAEVAYERTSLSPRRRVVVLGEDGDLLGLVCLNPALTGFCTGRPGDPC
jgi:CBS domain-containing protein